MAKRSQRRHRMRRIMETVYNTPLAITAEKASQIVEFLNRRAAGVEITREQLQEAYCDETDRRPRPYIQGGVCVLPLYGTLGPRMNLMLEISGGTSTQEFGQWYEAALANPDVRAILVDCDSPGGFVPYTAECARIIYEGRGVKPSVCVANMLCASAALWIGSACGRFLASPSSQVGSHGVMHAHQETSKLDAKDGRTTTLITSVPHKAEFNTAQPLSEADRKRGEERVAQIHAEFTAALALHRGQTAEYINAHYGQGRLLLAQEALDVGLVDELASFDDVFRELMEGSQPRPGRGHAGRVTVAAGSSERTIPPRLMKGSSPMWKKLRAALAARGLCTATAGQAEVRQLVGAMMAAHGFEFTNDEEAVRFLGGLPQAQSATPPPQANAGQGAGQATGAGSPMDDEEEEAATDPPGDDEEEEGDEPSARAGGARRLNLPVVATPQRVQRRRAAPATDQVILAERQRIRDIRARGTLIGADPELIESVIDSGVTLEAACERFTAGLASGMRPVQTAAGGDGAALMPGGTMPTVQGSPIDRIVSGASEALYSRICHGDQRHAGRQAPQLTAAGRQFQHMGLMQVAQAYCNAMGHRTTMMAPDDVAIAFLQSAGRDLVPLASSITPGNAPANYPNLMSVLANKVMEGALEFSEATWRMWCSEISPVPDFKPVTFLAMGAMGELSYHKDGDPFEEGKFTEDASWVSVDSFGRELRVTPMMVVNNNLTSFAEMFEDTKIDHDLTVNRLCVDLLTGNPTLPDTIQFIHASHGNTVASGSGGVPSTTQAALMRKAMRKQLTYGGKRRLRIGPSVALVPTDLETAAEQVFSPLTVVPVTEATATPFKGKITPVVEPMLDDASTSKWYAFADPRRVRTIVVAFMQGFQNGGKIQTYFEPKNQSQIFQIEGRFGAAVRNYRGVVENFGS